MKPANVVWPIEDIQYLKDHSEDGLNSLAKHFQLTTGAVRFAAKKYEVHIATAIELKQRIKSECKKEPEERANAKYTVHLIDQYGGTKVWIPAEKLFLTIKKGRDIQEAVDKIVFRHDKIKFD